MMAGRINCDYPRRSAFALMYLSMKRESDVSDVVNNWSELCLVGVDFRRNSMLLFGSHEPVVEASLKFGFEHLWG